MGSNGRRCRRWFNCGLDALSFDVPRPAAGPQPAFLIDGLVAQTASLFDHLISAGEQGRWKRKTQRTGSL